MTASRVLAKQRVSGIVSLYREKVWFKLKVSVVGTLLNQSQILDNVDLVWNLKIFFINKIIHPAPLNLYYKKTVLHQSSHDTSKNERNAKSTVPLVTKVCTLIQINRIVITTLILTPVIFYVNFMRLV